MKILTVILVFLASFILGYSIADHTKLPNRVYILEDQEVHVKWKKGEGEAVLTLTKMPEELIYFSKEKAKDKLKHMAMKEFVSTWHEMKTMNQEALFMTFESHEPGAKQQHALLQDIYHDAEKDQLLLKITPPLHETQQTIPSLKNSGEKTFPNASLHIFQMQ